MRSNYELGGLFPLMNLFGTLGCTAYTIWSTRLLGKVERVKVGIGVREIN